MNQTAANINEILVGYCGKCGSNVVLPRAIWSTQQPEPRCKSCGAIAKNPSLPTLPMKD